ncbi:DUF1427 family protein [Akkermansiaceae bacterium]|nr:DUF1427 family protein [Akkermansiaceae bacterium]
MFELGQKRRDALEMTTILAAIGTGLLVGLIFSAFKLPLPAPPVWAGIAGIVGIFLGGELWKAVVSRFFQ